MKIIKIIRKDENGELVDVGFYNEELGHFKIEETQKITFGDIKCIYEKYLGVSDFEDGLTDESIFKEVVILADAVGDNDFSLENKIILAITIRLKAENFVLREIERLNSSTNIYFIKDSQFGNLYKKYKKIRNNISRDDKEEIKKHELAVKILDKVSIATPENIHLNSFMYEPLLDMNIN